MDADSRDLQWQRRYEEDDTPWDKGAPAPPLTAFLREKWIAGRVLVPGCGRGHEVRMLGAQRGVSAVGLDLSATAIEQARALLSASAPPADSVFITGDFFRLPSEMKDSFDWIVEHTCFCAIDPRQRSEYVRAAVDALRDGGKIFAIFYLHPDVANGPPFAVSREELDRLFDPHFTVLDEWVPKEAFAGREGRELVRIMQKRGENS
jgi:SAM-dependent methyltransferase